MNDGRGEGGAQHGAQIEKAPAARSSLRTSKPANPAHQARRRITVAWYEVRCALGSRESWVRFGLIVIQVSSLGFGLFKAGIKTGVFSLGGFFAAWVFRSWRDGRRPNLKTFERNAAERSANLYRAVSDLQRREDREHRVTRARYPKFRMLPWEAIATGLVQLTGDVRADYPGMAENKPYTSILAVPVFYRGQRVAAVSIDSSSRYHFDIDWRELVDHLAPYVAMLGWTVVTPATTFEGVVPSDHRVGQS